MRTSPAALIFSQSGVLLALVGVWLYYAGWSYLANYLILLHITVPEITVPSTSYLWYGAQAASLYWRELIALIAALGTQAYFLWRLNLSGLRTFVLVVVFLATFFSSAGVIGAASGRTLYREVIYNLHLPDPPYRPVQGAGRPHYVQILLKPGVASGEMKAGAIPAVSMADDLASGCYVNIWTDTNAMYLVKVRPILIFGKTYQSVWNWDGSNYGRGLPYSTVRLALDSAWIVKIMEEPPTPCSSTE